MITLSIIIVAIILVLKYKRDIKRLKTELEDFHIFFKKEQDSHSNELKAYEITVQNLKATQCKEECIKEETTVKARKPRK